MTTTPLAPAPLFVETAPLERVTLDLYRNIHKAIRSEMFSVTLDAGRTAPDGDGLTAVADRLHGLVRLLVSHAEHEDEHVQPHIERHAPTLAAIIERDHPVLESQLARLEVLADRAAGAARAEQRAMAHRLYLSLSSFSAAYLVHQEFEEAVVMPALGDAMTVDELAAVEHAIVSSIPPDEMRVALSLMLPAMNVDDRTELLSNMRAGAPPEVFAGVVALAESVLERPDFVELASRLDIV